MGAIQTYYYLAIIGITGISLALVLVLVAFRQLPRLFREGDDPLVAWLITGAVLLVFILLVTGTIGVLLGMAGNGTAQS